MGDETMRIDVELDRTLVERGLEATGLETPQAFVDHALRELLRREDQRGLLELRGQIEWVGDLDDMRGSRVP